MGEITIHSSGAPLQNIIPMTHDSFVIHRPRGLCSTTNRHNLQCNIKLLIHIKHEIINSIKKNIVRKPDLEQKEVKVKGSVHQIPA
jgi:hypothetical protein